MRNAKWTIVVATLFVSLLNSRASRADDLTALQGTWVIRSAFVAGKPFAEPVGDKITFTDVKMTVQIMGDKQPAATFKLDATKMPKQIDVTHKNKTAECIYELVDDSLTLCLASPGDPRPTALENKVDDEHLRLVLERSEDKEE